MSYLVSTDRGVYDLHTNIGRYRYLSEYLCKQGASSEIFSCLENIYSDVQEQQCTQKQLDLLNEVHEGLCPFDDKQACEFNELINSLRQRIQEQEDEHA